MSILALILSCDITSNEPSLTVSNITFETDELVEVPYDGEITKIRYQDRCWWEYSTEQYIEIDVERVCAYYSYGSEIRNINIRTKSNSNCELSISLPSLANQKSMGKLSWTEATVALSLSCSSTIKQNITIHSMGRIDGIRCEGKSKVLLK